MSQADALLPAQEAQKYGLACMTSLQRLIKAENIVTRKRRLDKGARIDFIVGCIANFFYLSPGKSRLSIRGEIKRINDASDNELGSSALRLAAS